MRLCWQIPVPPAVLALAPLAVMRANARAPAVLAFAPAAVMRADGRPPAVLALAPDAVMRADARAPAVLAGAPFAAMGADGGAPAVLAFAPDERRVSAQPTPPLRTDHDACTRATGAFILCRDSDISSILSSFQVFSPVECYL